MAKRTVLFLAANPCGTDPRALDREAHAIRAELKRSGYRDRFQLETRWAVQPLDLLRELRELQPAVVHFSGHGGPDGLFFQAADGRAQVVSPEAIAETFGAAGASVQLVVLSACYGDAAAEALIAHVDSVVGMSGALHDQAARAFAIGFYGALGEHESVAAAYRHGNAAIRLEGLSEAERPQLKVRDGFDAATLIPAAAPPEGSGKSSLVAAGVLSPPHGATASRKIDLVDVSFDDNEPRNKSSSCPVLDFKMVNRSISTIFVKRVDLHIQAVWKVPPYHPLTIALGLMNCSASYDLTIPDRAPPFVLSQQISHVLKPDEAERFQIVLHRPASEHAVLSMIAKVVYGSEGFEESSGELLCAFRNYDKLGRWDAHAHRICIQLVGEVRERKGHMSKRLLELLEDIESGRRYLELSR